MAKKRQKNIFVISLVTFIITGLIALYLILNKGHIGNIALVNTKTSEEEKLTQTIEVSVEKDYLSAKSKEEANIIVKVDGQVVTEGVEYASSNDEILEIVDGKAIAKGTGKATITARVGEIADTADIHVIIPIKTLKFTSTSKAIRVGKELQMKLQTTPSDASIETLTYESSDEEIATVNNNGIVTGVSKGKVTITVKDAYTGEEKSVDLTIK